MWSRFCGLMWMVGVLACTLQARVLFEGWSGVWVAEDRYVGGNSQTYLLDTTSELRFQVALRPSHTFPFAGVKIPLHPRSDGSQFIDLRGSEGIRVNVQTDGLAQLRIILKTVSGGNTDPGDPRSYRFFEIEVNGLGKDTLLRWEEFQIPSWWATPRGIGMADRWGVPSEDLRQAAWIELLSGYSPKGLDTVTWTVKSLRMESTPSKGWRGWLWGALFIVLGATLYRWRRPKSRQKNQTPEASVVLAPRPLAIADQPTQEARRVLDWIQTNYMNPDLSLEVVSKELGIPTYKISQIFKESLGLSFKAGLADLRLTEAARQLRNTSLTIQEVAYGVGYNHVAHFNRQFREKLGKSPTDYRKMP